MTVKEILAKNMKEFEDLTNEASNKIVEQVRKQVDQLIAPKGYVFYALITLIAGECHVILASEDIEQELLTNVIRYRENLVTDNWVFDNAVVLKTTKALEKEGGEEVPIPSEEDEDFGIKTAIRFRVKELHKRKSESLLKAVEN